MGRRSAARCAGFQLRSGEDVKAGYVELCKLANPKGVTAPPATHLEDADAPAEPLPCAETPSEGGAPDGGGGLEVPAPVLGAGFMCCLYSE